MNTGAIDIVLANSDRSMIDELELHRYGLRFVIADPWSVYLNPDGASIAL